MKLILLFLCLITCSSYTFTRMTQVSIIYPESLPIYAGENKYFFFKNNEYSESSNYIYFILEDKNFGLNYNNIKYCYTKDMPDWNSEYVVKKCSFNTISYYSYQSSSSSIKYYYKISANSSFTYSIIFYEGKNSSGSLYVITDYKDLNLNVNITKVSKNSRTPLPISSSYHKYFYLNNWDYIITNYIYFYLEDPNFGLNCKSIKYCFTDINPYGIYSQSAIAHCSFTTISTYSYQSTSNSTKYYYKIYSNNKYYYSIIYYEGRYSSGSLYVYSDYNNLNKDIKMIQVFRNLTTSLPTTSEYKYFYLTKTEYNKISQYIFICFED